MDILAKFVLNQEKISLILQTEDHPAIFCCEICSSAIHSLAKLTTQIENITISLRAVISSRNGLFSRIQRNEPTLITKFPHTGSDGVCQRDDLENIDDLQLPGDIEEEEFCVKVEPPSDHENNVDDDDELNEIGSDPLFIPEESDDADANLPDSGVDVASKFVCTLCKPNVAVTTIVTLKRHLKNTKVHENISRADYLAIMNAAKAKKAHVLQVEKRYPCAQCEKRFGWKAALVRHVTVVHKGVRYMVKCTLCPGTFLDRRTLESLMVKCHEAPKPVAKKRKERYSCEMCERTFATSSGMQRHVEMVHFQDKTSCPYGCQTDNFDSEAEWVTHLVVCDSTKMRACVCYFCNLKFRTTLLRTEHCLRAHPDKVHICAGCGAKFTRQDVLKSHRCGENVKKSRVQKDA
ncbi:zinc finger protein 423-like [Folsomia candida]|uniref:zinc finger protein 423-like n=1 Tax=Folsomia candida TaxID=158441 RepID=UPI001604B4B6|nr:zinc finger protein 423-like [Folsomia candida]